jgi:hypothetical protein
MRRNKSNTTISPHTIFHDCMSDTERMKFLIAEVSNLTLQEQYELVMESFTKMLDYMDVKKMSVEIMHIDEDEVYSVTQYN